MSDDPAKPLERDKLIKLTDFEPYGLSAEHIQIALLEAWYAPRVRRVGTCDLQDATPRPSLSLCCCPPPSALPGLLSRTSPLLCRRLTPSSCARTLVLHPRPRGPTGNDWQKLFTACGYDGQTLRPTKGAEIPITLGMHSSQKLTMRLAELPPALGDHTLCQAVTMHGNPTTLGGGGVGPTLYVLSTGSGAIFAASNSLPGPLSMTIDCHGSSNVHTNAPGGGFSATALLPPAGNAPGVKPAAHFMMALTASHPADGYSWKYNVKGEGQAARGQTTTLAPPDLLGDYRALVGLADVVNTPHVPAVSEQLPAPARLPAPGANSGARGPSGAPRPVLAFGTPRAARLNAKLDANRHAAAAPPNTLNGLVLPQFPGNASSNTSRYRTQDELDQAAVGALVARREAAMLEAQKALEVEAQLVDDMKKRLGPAPGGAKPPRSCNEQCVVM